MLYGMPRGPWRAFVRVVRRASERGPAAPPSIYVTEAGKHAHWRPATRSGKYLSAAQYEAQKKKATVRSIWVDDQATRISILPAAAAAAAAAHPAAVRVASRSQDAELKKHFSSPEYQKWLMNNHGRMKIDETGEETRGRRLSYSDDDD